MGTERNFQNGNVSRWVQKVQLTNNLSELGAEIPSNLMIIVSIVIIRKKYIPSSIFIYLYKKYSWKPTKGPGNW